jgi:hypothetical protein
MRSRRGTCWCAAVALAGILAVAGSPRLEAGEPPKESSLETLQKYYRDEVELGKTSTETGEALCRLFKSLSPEEADALLRWGFEKAPEGRLSAILENLSCLRKDGLRGRHDRLVARKIFYPDWLYRNADAKTRDALVALAEAGDKAGDHVLWSLAWIQDAAVDSKFLEWEKRPSRLHREAFAPRYCSESAGWIPREGGGRTLLYHETCIPLVAAGAQDADPALMSAVVPSKEKCRWCGATLAALFEIRLNHDRLKFLGIEGALLRIPICERCSMWETIYFKLDGEGGFSWHEKNKEVPEVVALDPGMLKGDVIRILPGKLAASKGTRESFEALDPLGPARHSQIGGLPTWIQTYDYPSCPSCGKPMVFIGQYSLDDVEEENVLEGIFHAFYCRACRVACAAHEQT